MGDPNATGEAADVRLTRLMPLLLGDPRTAPVALSKIPLDLGVTAAKGELALLLLFSLTADRERKFA